MPPLRGSANDLFAPPSPDELKATQMQDPLFAPPTADELKGTMTRSVNIPEEDESQNIFEKGLEKAAPYIQPVGRAIDRFTGAPVRAAIGEMQEGRFGAAPGKYLSQFGAAPELAPTGKELAIKAGLGNKTELSSVLPSLYSDTGKEWLKLKRHGLLDPTAAGAAGLGIDIAADPTNFIPVGAAAKDAGAVANASLKGGAVVGEGLLKGGAKVADVLSGTSHATSTIEKGAELAKKAKEAISHLTTPTRANNFGKLVETAKSIGVAPEELSAAVEFGKNSVPSRLERTIAEGPVGQKLLENHGNVANKIAESVDSHVQDLAGGMPIKDPVGAGESVKNAFAQAEKDVLDNSHLTYKSAAQLSPDLRLTPEAYSKLDTSIQSLKDRAADYMSKGATKEQVAMGRDLSSFANRLEKNADSYKGLSDQIGFIGEAMNDPGLNRVHARELRKIYHTVSDSLIDTVKDLHPDLGSQLVENNKTLSEFFKSRDALGSAIKSSKSNPEQLFRAITGDAVKIDELKKVLPEEEFNQLRSSYLDSLIRRNADGHILYDATSNALKKNSGRLSKMFSADEMTRLGDLLELGHAQGVPVLSTSGTGGSHLFKDIKEGIAGGLLNEETLKGLRGRGKDAVKNITPVAEALPKSVNYVDNLKKGILSRFTAPRRPGGLLLKGAQSVAPSQYEYPNK